MTNHKALSWASTLTTGKSGRRQLLDKLCEKADDFGRVWRASDEIAALCEMGYRTAVRHIDDLEELGFITQIRRMWPNAKEAKPILLINYPGASHLRGDVVVLDYLAKDGSGMRVMYPRDPIHLLEAGLRWSSNETIGAVHPSHTDRVREWRDQHQTGADDNAEPLADLAGGPDAKSAGGRHAKSASGLNSENTKDDEPNPNAKSAGGRHAKSASGLNSENTEKTSSDSMPNRQSKDMTNEGMTNQTTDPVAGWTDDQDDAPDPEGVRILQSLPYGVGDAIAGHVVDRWSHVVGNALNSGMDEAEVIHKLTSGLPEGDVTRRVRIVVGRRLKDLEAALEQAPARAAERAQTAEERAHEQVTRWADQGNAGAKTAATWLNTVWDPEPFRGEASAQEWMLKTLPKISRAFVEEHRDDLVAALTRQPRSNAA